MGYIVFIGFDHKSSFLACRAVLLWNLRAIINPAKTTVSPTGLTRPAATPSRSAVPGNLGRFLPNPKLKLREQLAESVG